MCSTIRGWTSAAGWDAGHVAWFNFCRWRTTATDVYRRTVAECWNTVRWRQIDADRCRQWQTRAACDTECLRNTYWHLWQFVVSRGETVACRLLADAPLQDVCTFTSKTFVYGQLLVVCSQTSENYFPSASLIH